VAQSLRDLDYLPDRIRHSRQSDRRGVVIVEGPSDQRLLDRVAGKRWATFPAGTRDQVVVVVAETIELGVLRVSGLIDRDFDDLAEHCSSLGMPVYSFGEADLEAELVRAKYFDDVIAELASPSKLAANGGVEELRRLAITFAMLVGLVRRQNTLQGWGINFRSVELHQRIDTTDMSLKVSGLCAVASNASGGVVSAAELKAVLETEIAYPPEPGAFRGKDALTLVQVALKRKWGEKRIEDWDVLPAMLRISVSEEILSYAPFVSIEELVAEVEE
jgi:hypothetical protein